MAAISEVAINVTARTQKLEKDLARAKAKLNKFGGSAKKAGGGLVHLGRMATGAAAAFVMIRGALGGFTSSLARIDEAAKKSRSLGMTTQQILQLQHSAELAGVSTSQLNTGLNRMVVGIQDAARGTGEASKVLEQMGINVADLAALSPHEQFMKIADAIRGIEDPAKKADAAYKLFGRSGVDLINMLDGGSDKLREQAAEFDKLHGKISETDSRAIEDANDAIADMKKAFAGAWVQITVLFAPAIKLVAGLLEGLSKILRLLGTGLRNVFGVFAKMLGITKKQTPATKDATKATQDQTAAMEDAEVAASKQAAAQEELKKQQEDLARAGQQVTDQFKTPQQKFQDRMAHLDKLVRAGAISWETYSRAVKGAIQDVKKANQRQIQAARPIAAVTMGSTAGFSAVQQANREQERQTQLQRQENRLTEETNRILRGVERELKDDPEVANI